MRQREKMAALGTLAAGLAHELNNPAAAISRVVDRLRHVLDALYEASEALRNSRMPLPSCGALERLREDAEQRVKENKTLDPLVAADREDELSDWLTRQGVEQAWLVAPTLVARRHRADNLGTLREAIGLENFPAAVRWVASSVELAMLLDEAGRGSARIADLLRALKSYSYEGQAPLQEVDLHDGIEDTLTIMRHKLKQRDQRRARVRPHAAEGARVRKRAEPGLDESHRQCGRRIDGEGTLTIRTRRDGEFAVVEIGDDGPGIPAEIQPRVFDPFFTTKDARQGHGARTGHHLSLGRESSSRAHPPRVEAGRHALRSDAADRTSPRRT